MVAEVVFGTVAEDDDIAVLFMLFEGIPNAFFLTQTVDKGKVAFEILGHIFADGVAAAFLETVVDAGEAVVFEDGGNDVRERFGVGTAGKFGNVLKPRNAALKQSGKRLQSLVPTTSRMR